MSVTTDDEQLGRSKRTRTRNKKFENQLDCDDEEQEGIGKCSANTSILGY